MKSYFEQFSFDKFQDKTNELKEKTQSLFHELVDINTESTKEVLSAVAKSFDMNPKSDTYLKVVNDSLDTFAINVKKAIKFEGYTFEGYKG